MQDRQRAERLSKLSLDYRVALAHSPIDPKQVHAVPAAWLNEQTVYGDIDVIRYGFVLSYRGRWAYVWGQRWSNSSEGHYRSDHSYQWFDEEPKWMYDTRAHEWEFGLDEVINGPHFATDEEAKRPTPGDGNPNSGERLESVHA